MKLLFDHNLSYKLVGRLADLFPDAAHVRNVHLHEADDPTVWEYARANGFAIVSKDEDFHQLSFLYGAPPKTEDKLTVDLADGRSLVVPLAWYPRLVQGSPAERQHWQLLGDGYAIEWPELDEHIGVEGLLAGRRSGESAQSFARWMASRRTPAE